MCFGVRIGNVPLASFKMVSLRIEELSRPRKSENSSCFKKSCPDAVLTKVIKTGYPGYSTKDRSKVGKQCGRGSEERGLYCVCLEFGDRKGTQGFPNSRQASSH